MMRKFENMVEETQEEFKQALDKLEKLNQQNEDVELTDTQTQLMKHFKGGNQLTDTQFQKNQSVENEQQENQEQ